MIDRVADAICVQTFVLMLITLIVTSELIYLLLLLLLALCKYMIQGCHWPFAKITENLRVRAVSQKMNTKRDKVQKEKDEI